MKLRTVFQLEPFDHKIAYKDKLLFLGSCFSENVSAYFQKYRFQVVVNPFGILYHPLALERFIEIALSSEYEPETFSIEYKGVWSNLHAHSSLSATSQEKLIKNLNSAKALAQQSISDSNYIFISLGTAWYYNHLGYNISVANCHKLPQIQFEKKLLKLQETIDSLESMITQIININSKAKIIFTLSPVRHIKDGFIENQMSKSTLHLAIQEIVKNFKNISYFPSYEIVLDDLRDYRFYDKDLIHPNTMALDYIWTHVENVLLSDETQKILEQVKSINNRLNHRLFNPNTKESKAFLSQTDRMINSVIKKHSYIKF